tara:strand:+ start:413 stop:1000 length:588 start_codon:yes stop_codon:yes gene_type:complete
MPNKQKKHILNFKIFSFFFLSPFLVSIPFFSYVQGAKAGLEFQWDQDSTHRRLNWYQKESVKSVRNKIYFFLRPNDRLTNLLKIDLIIPETYKSKIKDKNISFCKVKIGGFEGRTKCLEDIPADMEIKNEESEESSFRRLTIYPYSPIEYSKDSYAIVLKALNPRRSGLYQFHSYGQPAGKTSTRYLGSWTIVID